MSDDKATKPNGEAHETGQPEASAQELQTVREVLETAGLEPKPIDGAQGFTVDFKDDGPNVKGAALLIPAQKRFFFYLELDKLVPVDKRPLVAEFITRANYGIGLGNFEMDYDGGGVRYKTTADYLGMELTPAMVRNAMLAAMNGVELYADELNAVVVGNKTPEQAIRDAEA
jgi:hypothetical protein